MLFLIGPSHRLLRAVVLYHLSLFALKDIKIWINIILPVSLDERASPLLKSGPEALFASFLRF